MTPAATARRAGITTPAGPSSRACSTGPDSIFAARRGHPAGPESSRISAFSTRAGSRRTPPITSNPGGATSPCSASIRTGTGRAERARSSPSAASAITRRSSCSSTAHRWGKKTCRATAILSGRSPMRPACSRPAATTAARWSQPPASRRPARLRNSCSRPTAPSSTPTAPMRWLSP